MSMSFNTTKTQPNSRKLLQLQFRTCLWLSSANAWLCIWYTTPSGVQCVRSYLFETVAQTWEQLLHFSGWALNLKKCSWYVMYCDWRKGRPQLCRLSTLDPSIKMLQGSTLSQQTATIGRQGINKLARILGVHKTPSGDFSEHIKVLKAKADKFVVFLKSPQWTPGGDIRVFNTWPSHAVFLASDRGGRRRISSGTGKKNHSINSSAEAGTLQ